MIASVSSLSNCNPSLLSINLKISLINNSVNLLLFLILTKYNISSSTSR